MIKVRKGGIYQNIESSEFGIYQTNGWEKVINQSLPKLEDVKPEPIVKDEPIAKIVDEEPIKEVAQQEQELPKLDDVKPETVEDIIVPKSKRRKH